MGDALRKVEELAAMATPPGPYAWPPPLVTVEDDRV